MFSLENFIGIMCRDTSDAEFKGKLDHGLKNDIRHLVNFHVGCRKSENLHINELLLTRVYNV